MKTIQEIKTEMTDAILANVTLVEAMELDTSKTWNEQTSPASVLNILLYIIAVSWYALQWMFEQFKTDVEERILAALPGTASWYWNRAMAFQYGDAINDSGGYNVIDSEKQMVKYCAVVDAYQGVLIKVNAADHAKLTPDQMTAFEEYMNKVKFAGCRISVSSLNPDQMKLQLAVKIDPMVLRSDYTTIEGNENVIQKAVETYLAGITYGGVFSKTKLIDAIQAIDGVKDVYIKTVRLKAETDPFYGYISSQNYTAVSGSIQLNEITYTEYE